MAAVTHNRPRQTTAPRVENKKEDAMAADARVTALQNRVDELEKNEFELLVAEVESVVSCENTGMVRVRLKGQRPDDKCLLELYTDQELIKPIHEAKKRGGTVWLRFRVEPKPEECKEECKTDEKNTNETKKKRSFSLVQPELVVRDLLE